MKYCWTTIYVTHMEQSLQFYGDLVGLPLVRRFSPVPGMEIVFLGEGIRRLN